MSTDALPSSQDLFYENLISSYVDLPRFIAREWIWQRVQAALNQPHCRFVLLTAEPGAGKSAFMAWVARNHPQWPRYFIRRDQRTPLEDGGARGFLEKIGFQLSAIFPEVFQTDAVRLSVSQDVGQIGPEGQVTGAEVDRLIASPFYAKAVDIIQEVKANQGNILGIHVRELVTDPNRISLRDLQRMALLAPAMALERLGRTDPHVVLIDAVDELRYRASGDTVLGWLTQCPELPANVRILLTSRPDREWLAAFRSAQQDRLVEEIIPDVDENVTRDLAEYAAKVAATPQVASFLITHMKPKQSPEAARDEFAAGAVEKAKGNLGYLAALGRAIDQAIASTDQPMLEKLLELRRLPDTLQDLYGHFLKLIRQTVGDQSLVIEDPLSHEQALVKAWPNAYRPVLGILAVAREPLAPSHIRRLGRMLAGDDDVSGIVGRLRQFLDERGGRYTFYHATLPEFLTAESTRTDAQYRELAVDPALWHGKIVVSYRGQASTWDQVDWHTVDDYGLLHLAGHLYALREQPEYRSQLYGLLCKPFMENKLSRFHSHKSFSNDVDLAIRVAAAEESPAGLVQFIRACLIYATLGTRATGVPPEVLGTLAQLGEVPRALDYAALVQDPSRQSEAYRRIGQALLAQGKKEEGKQAVHRALALAEAIQDEKDKADCLSAVAQAIAQAGEGKKAVEIGNRALGVIETRRGIWSMESALTAVAQAMRLAGDNEGLKRVLAVAEVVQHGWQNRPALTAVAQVIALAGRNQDALKIANDALAATEKIQEFLGHKTKALADVAGVMAEAGDKEGLNRALGAAEAIPDAMLKASALSAVARALANAGDKEEAIRVAKRALAAAEVIENKFQWGRASALSDVADAMGHAGDKEGAIKIANRALAVAEAIREWDKASALGALAQAMAETGDKEDAMKVANRAMAAAEASPDDEYFKGDKAFALSKVAQAMVQAGKKEDAATAANRALAVVETIHQEDEKSSALNAVAEAMVQTGDKEGLNRALTAAGAIMEWNQASALSIVVKGLVRTGDKDGLNRAVAVPETIEYAANHYQDLKASALSALAEAMVQAGDREGAMAVANRALAAAEAIQDEWNKTFGLVGVAEAMGQAGAREDAIKVSNRSQAVAEESRKYQASALSDVAKAMAQAGAREDAIKVANRALAVAEAIQDERNKAFALMAVAKAMGQAGDREEAVKLAKRALAAAEAIEDEDESSKAIDIAIASSAVAEAMAQAGDTEMLNRALGVAETIQNDGIKASALMHVAEAMGQKGDKEGLNRTLAVAQAIQDDKDKTSVLSAVARAMGESGDKESLNRAMAAAEAIQDEGYRTRVLNVVAHAMAQAGEYNKALQVLKEAFWISRRSGREGVFKALESGAGVLAFMGRGDTLRQVYEALQEVDSWWSAG
jgi:tetratricopeptide (TPR) repeat protein